MSETGTEAPEVAPQTGFGGRNIAYAVFVLLCLLAMWGLEAGSGGSDAAGRGAFIIMGIGLWVLVTLPFAIWNLVALLGALAKNGPARHAGIALLLVIICAVLGGPVVDGIWHAIY